MRPRRPSRRGAFTSSTVFRSSALLSLLSLCFILATLLHTIPVVIATPLATAPHNPTLARRQDTPQATTTVVSAIHYPIPPPPPPPSGYPPGPPPPPPSDFLPGPPPPPPPPPTTSSPSPTTSTHPTSLDATIKVTQTAKAVLAVLGGALSFYLWSTLLAASFVRRSRSKSNVIFWMLLCSQAIGLACFIFQVVAAFVTTIECKITTIVLGLCLHLSHTFLFTGIMGLKAYRCLGDPKPVAVILFSLRTSMLILTGLNIPQQQGERIGNLTVCSPGPVTQLAKIMMLLQFVEAAFLWACYVVAVGRSSRTMLTQRLSIDEREGDETRAGRDSAQSRTRGWWDYVPELPRQPALHVDPPPRGIIASARAFFSRALGDTQREEPPNIVFQRKPSLPGEFPIRHPGRVDSAGSSSTAAAKSESPAFDARSVRSQARTAPMPIQQPSAFRLFIRTLLSRELLRQMLRNELLYTAAIAVVFLGLIIVLQLRLAMDVPYSEPLWITIEWLIVSILSMRNSARVIARQEYEAIMQHPEAWAFRHRRSLELVGLGEFEAPRARTPPPRVPPQLRPRRPHASVDPDLRVGTGAALHHVNHHVNRDAKGRATPEFEWACAPPTPASSASESDAPSAYACADRYGARDQYGYGGYAPSASAGSGTLWSESPGLTGAGVPAEGGPGPFAAVHGLGLGAFPEVEVPYDPYGPPVGPLEMPRASTDASEEARGASEGAEELQR